MATHNLEEDPNLFIAPKYHHDKFVYRMFHSSGDEDEILVRIIDLRSDRLMIYGTEMNESVLDKLHQSLILEPGTGALRVNCHGACYFVLPGKVRYWPVHNVIFDWSQFGVIVPNSMNDSLRKKLEQKEKEIEEMNNQLSSNLEASKKEVEELKEQLCACKGERKEMEARLEKLCGQLSLSDSELESKKNVLELSKKEVKEFEDRLSTCIKASLNMEVELQRLCDQLSSTNSELKSTTNQLELSKERVMELEEQLSSFNVEGRNMEIELQKLQDQLSLVNSELKSTKTQLESSNKIVKEFEDQLSFPRKGGPDELSSVNLELQATKSQLESSKERVKELEKQLSARKKEIQERREELQKVQSSVKMLQELKDQLFTWRREDLHGGAELQKVSRHLWSIDSEVKSTRQKLEEMWNELSHSRHSQSGGQYPPIADSLVHGARTRHSLLPPKEDLEVFIAIDEDISPKYMGMDST